MKRAASLAVFGLAVGVWGWYGVSGEVRLREQEVWAVVVCLGAAIAACGGVYLVTVGMREVRLGQRQVMFDLADVLDWSVTVTKRGRLQLDTGDRGESESAPQDSRHAVVTLVTGPGMTVAHRGECPVARGKAVQQVSAADVRARALGACAICRSGPTHLGEAS